MGGNDGDEDRGHAAAQSSVVSGSPIAADSAEAPQPAAALVPPTATAFPPAPARTNGYAALADAYLSGPRPAQAVPSAAAARGETDQGLFSREAGGDAAAPKAAAPAAASAFQSTDAPALLRAAQLGRPVSFQASISFVGLESLAQSTKWCPRMRMQAANALAWHTLQDWAGRAAQLPGHRPADDDSVTSGVGRGHSSSGSAPNSSTARQDSAAADMSERSGLPSLVAKPSPSNDRAVESQAHVDQTANDALPITEPSQGQELEGTRQQIVCVAMHLSWSSLQQQAQWQQSVQRALACCHGKHCGQVPRVCYIPEGERSVHVDVHADGAAVTSLPLPKHSASAALANGISAWLAAPSTPEAPSQGTASR